MIITQAPDPHSPFQRGDEITAINGIAVRQILDSLLTVSRSDGNHALGKKYFNINETSDEANAYSLFDIYFPLFFPAPDYWTISVKSFGDKAVRFYKIMPLSLKERLTAYESRYGSFHTGEKSWNYQRIDQRTADIKFGTFAFWNSHFNEKKMLTAFSLT